MGQQFPFEHFFQGRPSNVPTPAHVPVSKEDTEQLSLGPNEQTEQNFLADLDSHPTPQSQGLDLDLISINKEFHQHIKAHISAEKYFTFFESTFNLVEMSGETLSFAVSTQFIKIMVEGNYLELIKTIAHELLNRSFNIELLVSGQQVAQSSNKRNILNGLKTPAVPEESRPKSVKDVRFTLDLTPTRDDLMSKVESTYINHVRPDETGISIDPKKTFDNFIVGPSNNMAYAMARAVAEAPNRPAKKGKYPSLYFYSGSGLGKTHLLHSIANRIKEMHPELVIFMLSATDFMKELILAIQTRKQHEFQQRYRERVDILMIDDIHELTGKDTTQDEFFHVFNAMKDNQKQVIFTSDKKPHEIVGLPDRLRTRLQGGLVIDIQRPDLETRMAILKNVALDLDLFVPEEALHLIAASIKNSIRELEGALIKLSAFADVLQTDIDIEMVKEHLALSPSERSTDLTVEQIARGASLYFKIPLPDIKSKSRNTEITKARHVAMYLSKKRLDCTFEEIGQFFGGRHHSTVIHAIKEVTEQIGQDKDFAKDIHTLESSL